MRRGFRGTRAKCAETQKAEQAFQYFIGNGLRSGNLKRTMRLHSSGFRRRQIPRKMSILGVSFDCLMEAGRPRAMSDRRTWAVPADNGKSFHDQDQEIPMKFACLVYYDQSAAPSEADMPEIVAECQDAAAWNEGIRKSGHHVITMGLQSVSTAKTVRRRKGRLTITDGPFAETNEGLGGFTIIEARDLDEALELVSKFPARQTSVEVRPIMDPTAELSDPGDQMVTAAVQRASQPRP
jgi:hypothetical protein